MFRILFCALQLLPANFAIAESMLIVSGSFKHFNPKTDGDIEVTCMYSNRELHIEYDKSYLNDDGRFRFEIPRLHKDQLVKLQIPHYLSSVFLITKDLHLELDVRKSYYRTFRFKPSVKFSGSDAASAEFSHLYADRFSLNQPGYPESSDAQVLSDYYAALYQHHLKALKNLPDTMMELLEQNYRYNSESRHLQASLTDLMFALPDSFFAPSPVTQVISYNYLHYLMSISNFLWGYHTLKNIELTAEVVKPKLNKEEYAELENHLNRMRTPVKDGIRDSLLKIGKQKFETPYAQEIFQRRLSYFKSNVLRFGTCMRNELLLVNLPTDFEKRRIYLDSLNGLFTESWAFEVLNQSFRVMDEVEEMVHLSTQQEQDTGLLGRNIFLSDSIHMYENRYEPIKDLIHKIHDEFPSEIVVLDIWATWCGPCIADMKASKKIKGKLKENGIAVVYLCDLSSSSLENWVHTVQAIGVEGKHIAIGQEQIQELFKEYHLNGFPSYLVMDKTGKLHAKMVKRVSQIKPKLLVHELRFK